MNDKITIDHSVVEQALDALEMLTDDYDDSAVGLEIDAITALRQALSDNVEQPAQQQEPVAWRYKIVDCFGRPVWTLKTPKTDTRVLESQPLYANPQTIDKSAAIRIATALGWGPKNSGSVEWVGLTDEDFRAMGFSSRPRAYAAIAAKLKEKNNG